MDENLKVVTFTELKLDTNGEGTFEAVFATMDAIDSHGDTYDPGAIGVQNVVISQYNHGSWSSGAKALPIGVGVTSERGNKAIISGEFDMSDEDAIKTYRKLKYFVEKNRNVEWSFALMKVQARWEEREGDFIRVIMKVQIPEVSPVLVGAGVDTELLAIKGDNREADRSKQFTQHLDEAVETVERVVGRAKEIRNLREEKGKSLSKAAVRRLKALRDALTDAVGEVDELLDDPNEEFNRLANQIRTGGKSDVEATG